MTEHLGVSEEYAALVDSWERRVKASPDSETYLERWKARLRHPSWEEKRELFLWYTDSRCERCEGSFPKGDLQLHHLHYDTLWYERNQDLLLLCPACHRAADRERAEEEAATRQRRSLSFEERVRAYMEIANRSSGQSDWPVTYAEAAQRILES